ncbi:O-methyltransferase [Ornithinimicrobium cavernae]|uniref:O-methyltransferase n=1 Tax=Ornithinimicrobium cavernae TaxID=2666047 RepID=UPI000D69ADE4|nr:O-methyltransferase [Ornithinimicrobium cavernae]
MSTQKLASWAYAESFIAPSELMERAAGEGEALGAVPVHPAVGSVLRLLAASLQARTVVEIGTGAGSSGLWLLQGMAPDGILTTIDVEPEHQRMAKKAFAEAGIPPQRTRVIGGDATQVLPRLNDATYDMVLIDADKPSYPLYAEHGIRVLRRGGILVLDNMLWHDRVADPAARDESTTVIRDLGKTLREDDRLVPALLPVGDGLFAAVKR